MKNRNVTLVGGALLFFATLAWACGPFFPQAFLPYRNVFMKFPIQGDFEFEMRRYANSVRSGPPVGGTQDTKSSVVQRIDAESQGVSTDQLRLIGRMRQAKDGDEAYAIGKSLPTAIRLYTAGAVDFQKAYVDSPVRPSTVDNTVRNGVRCASIECTYGVRVLFPTNPATIRAIARFEAVLALQENERQSRAVWAAYSLGEIYLNYQLPDRRKRASKYYELVRKLARAGTPDPLGLARSSLEQQASLKLDAGDLGSAVSLYMEQGNTHSLHRIAEMLVHQSARLPDHLKSRSVRRLLVAYTFSHWRTSPYTGKRAPWVQPTIDALIASGVTDIESIDRLGALSYQAGKYEDAERLVAGSETPLAHWVKSQLARRNGDRQLAAGELLLAGENKAALAKDLPSGLVQRLMLENVAARLDKGQSVKAFASLYAMGPAHWPDIAYVAERLLTIDELRTFVNALPPVSKRQRPPHPARNATGRRIRPEQPALTPDTLSERFGYRSTSDPDDVEPLDSAHQIRLLLARRLVRTERFNEALPYFSVSDLDVVGFLNEYAEAAHTAKSATDPIDKAEALFKEGLLTRKQGMELLGYELAPDFYYAEGSYGAESVLGFNSTASSARMYGRSSMSKAEMRRFNATTPRVDKRYHYRYLAVEMGREATRLLPARSQAYRAVLCHMAKWSPDDKIGRDIYKTYLRNGSYMNYPLAGSFGQRCEVPDFEGARRLKASTKVKIRRVSQAGKHVAST